MNVAERWRSLDVSVRKPPGQERKLSRGAVLCFFIGVLICCAIGNLIWLDSHWLMLPPPWDQAFYLYMGLRYLHALVDYGPIAAFREFIHLSPDVAPLYPLTTVPLYLLFGSTRLVAYSTNIFYLGLLLAGIYLLGAHLYGRSAGLLAAFVAATFTATVNYSRDYLLEFPASAFVTLGMYALVRSESFRRRPWCIALGVFAGCSVLTKTMTGVFFIGPVLFAFACLVWRHQLNAAVWRNCLLAVGVGVLVAAVWWGPNFRTAVGYLVYYGFQAGSAPYNKGDAGVLSLENLSYYALHLMNHGLSFFYTLLFVGLIMFVGSKACLGAGRVNIDNMALASTGARQASYLWVWLLMGYLILTLVPNKGEERYAQPLLPPIALILAGSIAAIGRRWVRRGIIALTLVVGTFNYLGLTYGLLGLPQRLSVKSVAIIGHEYPHYRWVRSNVHPASELHWPISEILVTLARLPNHHRIREITNLRRELSAMVQERSVDEDVQLIYRVVMRQEPDRKRSQGYTQALREGRLTRQALIDIMTSSDEYRTQRAKVLVVPDHPSFNASTLRYYAEDERLPLSFFHILDGPIDSKRLQMYDFVLVKSSGYQGPEFSTRYVDQIHASLLLPDSGFLMLPERFPFPDDSQIVIYAPLSTVHSYQGPP